MNRFLIGGLAVAAILAGSLGFYASTLEKPTYGVVDRGDWKNVSEEEITVNSTAWINNPNSIGFSLGFVDLTYSAVANNVTVASGDVSGLGNPSGNSTVDLETHVRQGKIPQVWFKHLKNGGKTTLSAPVTISLPFRSFTTTVFSKTVKTDIPEKLEESLDGIEGTYKGPRVSVKKIGTTVEERPELEIKDFQAS